MLFLIFERSERKKREEGRGRKRKYINLPKRTMFIVLIYTLLDTYIYQYTIDGENGMKRVHVLIATKNV